MAVRPVASSARAQVVDAVMDVVGAGVERHPDHDQRDRSDRQVHVEDPAPGQVVDEEAAQQRADHGRHAEDGAEESLVAAALAGREDVADDRQRQHDQPAAAQALQGAERDQLGHVLADSAQHRADQEQHDRRLQQRLSAVQIAELAVQGPGHGRREQVGGHHPGQVRQAAEVAHDGGQRGRDDRLVERGQQQHQHQRREDQAHALRGCSGGRGGSGHWRLPNRCARRQRIDSLS